MNAELTRNQASTYGVIAEFDTPGQLVRATEQAYQAGYRQMDAYAPFPVEGLADALGMHRSWIPVIVLLSGLAGGLIGYFFQLISMSYWYPLNVGGRPFNSLLMFVPVTFELTILFASLSAVASLVILNRLPQPYHPVFNVPTFDRATTDAFFLMIQTSDPHFEPERTSQFLRSLGAGGS